MHLMLEGMAVELYERLGLDPSEPVSPLSIARLWLGQGAIVRPTTAMTSQAMTATLNGQRFIAIKRGVSPMRERHDVGHELGHLLCDEAGYSGDDVEDVCNYLGAALMAPMPAVRRLRGAFGHDYAQLAELLVTTQTLIALRFAETLGITRAVVTPQRLYVRGPESFVWQESDVRREASKRRPRPGLRKVRLTDDPRRVVLDVEDVG